MHTLKKMISRYMQIITVMLVVVILLVVFVIQALNEQSQARERAYAMLIQLEQLLEKNQKDLIEVENKYKETCLHNAEAIAYIIEHHPDALESVEELQKIADFIEVDEIHIFDKTGRIFTGTHPDYFDFTFDSGEQMGFFKPMLEDKSLKLCQDITPNTAEAKLMQYCALWSANEEFIVQIGMEPVNVMQATEKNELSYIFSMLKVDAGVSFYAIDSKNGEIVGATISNDVGKHLSEIGLNFREVKTDQNGFHATVNGIKSFCVFEAYGSNLIGRVVSNDVLYERIPGNLAGLTICFLFVAVMQVFAMTKYMNRCVVNGIYRINEKLRLISKGNLDEHVNVQNSIEFAELSNHINDMIKSIMDNNKKMSYILTKTNMYMGIYEYNTYMKKVRYTEYVPKILGVNQYKIDYLTSDYTLFAAFLDKIKENPVPNEDGIFLLDGEAESYVRLEEINENNRIFGVLIDVTEEMTKRKQIEAERDVDSLTGLYNRRGIDIKLSSLFKKPETLGHGALIMIDADGLKQINDKYGHDKGDIYLRKIGNIINSFGLGSCVSSRQGGDEYVLFLYHYDSEEELLRTIETLRYIQHNSTVHLDDDLVVPLRFSFGYCLTKGRSDYQAMLKEADEKMYANKLKRKAEASQTTSQ